MAKPIAWAAGILAIVGILFGAYRMGETAGESAQKVILEQWKRQVLEQSQKRRDEQLARFNDLQGKFEALRNRPARIREVVKRVLVKADAKCPSLPANWRVLWNADTPDNVPKAAAAAPVDDATRVELAAAAEAVAEARARFEQNAAQLEGLQSYVRSVVGPFSEQVK